MKRGRRTLISDEELLQTVNEFSYNLQEGFRQLATKYNCSAETLTVRWYAKLKPKVIKDKTHSFGIIGKEAHGSCKNITTKNKTLLETCKILINGFQYNSVTSTWSNASF